MPMAIKNRKLYFYYVHFAKYTNNKYYKLWWRSLQKLLRIINKYNESPDKTV